MGTEFVPADVRGLVREAEAFVRVHRYVEAAARYRQALQQAPDNPLLHNNLGCTLANAGDLEGAIEHFRAAVIHGRRPGGASPPTYPTEPLRNLRAAESMLDGGFPHLPARWWQTTSGELAADEALDQVTEALGGKSVGLLGQLFPLLYLAPLFALIFAVINGIARLVAGQSLTEATHLSNQETGQLLAYGFAVAVVITVVRIATSPVRRRRRLRTQAQIAVQGRIPFLIGHWSIEPANELVRQHDSSKLPGHINEPPVPFPQGMAEAVPADFAEFLRLWWPYLVEALPPRTVSTHDPLLDYIPKIVSTGRTFRSDYRTRIEGVAQFIGLWRADGRRAHPAVNATMISYGRTIDQKGQSIGKALKKKGGDWITRLTLVGAFAQIDLLNLSGSVPRELEEPPADDDLGYRPFAILEIFHVDHGRAARTASR